MAAELPPGFKLKVLYTGKVDGRRCGLVGLMKPRRFWRGYKAVAQTSTDGTEPDGAIIERLLREYRGESNWI
ncbi:MULTISPECIES: hypothetical protein [Rhodococcus]|uniref:hypothetical protein n=1 Tax=Rhodococcus TaxID=1827 RepID=UPI001E5CE345|nr:hypothetical protein [Rhodococcus pyridinivorans]MCD2116790.1 hypothetical protein [Rhodococcus pyridinivorans]MCZ4626002.1 hypothetical protein [Rhodococcus pyridinivorans]MCZ4646957.1 hypothetical protein [Rhodococcus pyridinivorans]MDJ0480309.1 hypothetical protein [Rhodococcus pyridinivorans]MDV7253060.1 hypothetical protein [Rhodococcus pyridinivorans]